MPFIANQPYQLYGDDVGNIFVSQAGVVYYATPPFNQVLVIPTTFPPSTGGGNGGSSIVDIAISVNTTLTAAHVNKRLVCDCTVGPIVLTVPANLMTAYGAVFEVQIGAVGNVSWVGSGSVVNNTSSVVFGDGIQTGIVWIKAVSGGTYVIVG